MAKKNYKYQERIKQDWKQVTKDDVAAKGADDKRVRISFEYVVPGDHLCLSHCIGDDIRHAVDCFRRLTTMTWMQVYQTSTKNPADKTGIHWTPYGDGALSVNRPAKIDREHTIAGIRAGGKYRIFGFRFGDYFYVIWFDPEHKVCPV